jgi:hypothetical protein
MCGVALRQDGRPEPRSRTYQSEIALRRGFGIDHMPRQELGTAGPGLGGFEHQSDADVMVIQFPGKI